MKADVFVMRALFCREKGVRRATTGPVSTKRVVCDWSVVGLQSNFKKYADGGGFVSSELAARIVAAGPQLDDGVPIPASGPPNSGCC